MNIEIANRLVSLRKANHLSQEELAAKIGISRQAVSKWERAEACPDTDNLILLANLYKISLDELLKTDEPVEAENEEEEKKEEDKEENKEENKEEKNTISKFRKMIISFPYPLFVTLVYFILVWGFHLWKTGWIVFLTIPLFYWVRKNVRNW